MRGLGTVAAVALLMLSGCDKGVKIASQPPLVDPYAAAQPAEDFEDWYPEETDPPEGTEYAVRLTPLPGELKGLPGQDQRFINHVFSQILTLSRSNLRAMKALGTRDQDGGLDGHEDTIAEVVETIEGEAVPEGLEPFMRDLIRAIQLQQEFFVKARADMRKHMKPLFEGGADDETLQQKRLEGINGARRHLLEYEASAGKLLAAWGQLNLRYDGHWSKSVKQSLYQHLRAMQLD